MTANFSYKPTKFASLTLYSEKMTKINYENRFLQVGPRLEAKNQQNAWVTGILLILIQKRVFKKNSSSMLIIKPKTHTIVLIENYTT